MKKHQIETLIFIVLGVLALGLTVVRANIFYLLAFSVAFFVYTIYTAQEADEDDESF